MDSAIDPPGISLLAYMDGVVHSRTLSAVLIASASAAGSAIYKVIFKKHFCTVDDCILDDKHNFVDQSFVGKRTRCMECKFYCMDR